MDNQKLTNQANTDLSSSLKRPAAAAGEETPSRDWLMRRVAFYARECERQGEIIERYQRQQPIAAAAGEESDKFNEAKLRAYRQARVFEPSMEGYHAAMSVYAAAFGKPEGEIAVLLPNGSEKQPWEFGAAAAGAEGLKDDESRCAICAWPLDPEGKMCVRGNCSQRPFPDYLYASERAQREYGGHLDISKFRHTLADISGRTGDP